MAFILLNNTEWLQESMMINPVFISRVSLVTPLRIIYLFCKTYHRNKLGICPQCDFLFFIGPLNCAHN